MTFVVFCFFSYVSLFDLLLNLCIQFMHTSARTY